MEGPVYYYGNQFQEEYDGEVVGGWARRKVEWRNCKECGVEFISYHPKHPGNFSRLKYCDYCQKIRKVRFGRSHHARQILAVHQYIDSILLEGFEVYSEVLNPELFPRRKRPTHNNHFRVFAENVVGSEGNSAIPDFAVVGANGTCLYGEVGVVDVWKVYDFYQGKFLMVVNLASNWAWDVFAFFQNHHAWRSCEEVLDSFYQYCEYPDINVSNL